MDKQGEKITVSTTEARAGTRNGMRYILWISLALAVIAMAFVFFGGSFATRNTQKEGVAAEQAKQTELQQQGVDSGVQAKSQPGQNGQSGQN